MTSIDILYPIIGVLAGFLSGLLGVGGGVFIVPALAFVFTLSHFPQEVIMHMAEGTSLAIMIFTAFSSTWAHHYYRQDVDWSIVLRFIPSIIIGVISGAILAGLLNTVVLKILFGIFLIFISIVMFLLIKPKPSRRLPGLLLLWGVGYLIGFKSGLLGLGGGVLVIPFLIYCNVPMRKASGTSIGCTLTIAIVGTICFLLLGKHLIGVPHTFGFIYWPAILSVAATSIIFAPIGARLALHVPVNVLKRVFAIFLFIVALRLLF